MTDSATIQAPGIPARQARQRASLNWQPGWPVPEWMNVPTIEVYCAQLGCPMAASTLQIKHGVRTITPAGARVFSTADTRAVCERLLADAQRDAVRAGG
jgi:hypothetical protein